MSVEKNLLLVLAISAVILVTLEKKPESKTKKERKFLKFYQELSNNKKFSNKSHPCDLVKAKELEYGVKSKRNNREALVICKRYTEDELLNKMNCSGTFNKNYLAVTREEARKFPNLAKRHHRRLAMKEIQQPKRLRSYKNTLRKLFGKISADEAKNTFLSTEEFDSTTDDLGYGEMKVITENCQARWSLDGTKKRACGVCPTLTRQPQTPSRFPEYLNGLICHPSEDKDVVLSGQTIGTCVQETITMELVERTGQWVEDAALTAQNGVTSYVEKWNAYDQEINSTCSFSFYNV